MEPRISLVTLGVADLDRSVRFYRDGMGLPLREDTPDSIAFFQTSGAILALYPREQL
jgi:catechol 2,3-dioxygenase-like lactoylglutathione lyase family enzyme